MTLVQGPVRARAEGGVLRRRRRRRRGIGVWVRARGSHRHEGGRGGLRRLPRARGLRRGEDM
jgi:hypothetical protein